MFGIMVVAAELAGRSLTTRIDRIFHLDPLAPSGASYYPFLLVGVKALGALTLAGLLARGLRAWLAADAGRRILAAAGHPQEQRSPKLRPGLSPRVWAGAFVATSLAYLVHADVDNAADGRWALFAPWLHTYALPVFAALAVLFALAWRLASWLYEIEDYAGRTLEQVRRILGAPDRMRRSFPRPVDDAAPRRRFGLAFESRPPPLPA